MGMEKKIKMAGIWEIQMSLAVGAQVLVKVVVSSAFGLTNVEEVTGMQWTRLDEVQMNI